MLLNYRGKYRYPIEKIFCILPETYRIAYENLSERDKNSLSEIRIRANMPCTFTVGNKNVAIMVNGLPVKSSRKEISEIIENACQGSVYSFSQSISRGFVTFCSARIGIAGVSMKSSAHDADFSDITSINIRIPSCPSDASCKVTEYIADNGLSDSMGILAISPPSCGKTTFLRSLAKNLSAANGDFKFRVCLADERGELYIEDYFDNCYCDVYSGISKSLCVELATRTMSSQVVVFDEIANEDEANSLLKVSACGVYIVGSVHAGSLREALGKKWIRSLAEANVFKTAYILSRKGDSFNGEIKVLSKELENA